MSEICAGCGKPIWQGQASYYQKDPASDIGKTYHSACGDAFGMKAAVATERERCALIAENATMGLSPGPLYSAGFEGAKKFIAERIRATE